MKKNFEISLCDGKRVLDGLEVAASQDKTELYYILKKWADEVEKEPK